MTSICGRLATEHVCLKSTDKTFIELVLPENQAMGWYTLESDITVIVPHCLKMLHNSWSIGCLSSFLVGSVICCMRINYYHRIFILWSAMPFNVHFCIFFHVCNCFTTDHPQISVDIWVLSHRFGTPSWHLVHHLRFYVTEFKLSLDYVDSLWDVILVSSLLIMRWNKY